MFPAIVGAYSCAGRVRPECSSAIARVKACQVDEAPSLSVLLAQIDERRASLVVVDVPDERCLPTVRAILDAAAARKPAVPVVVLLGASVWSHQAELLNAGALECLGTPVNLSRLEVLVDLLTMRARCVGPPNQSPAQVPTVEAEMTRAGLVFSDRNAREVARRIGRLAMVQSTVLLLGETGVGKTRVAQMIHDLSPRRAQPFMTVQCGAIAESLIDSELFGHRKGAFTGADRDHRGKLQRAGAGTLFLDEIDSLPLSLQSKLLRVVEEHEFEAVGGDRAEPFEARLIVASNLDLEQEVLAGRFRADLYYRLNVVSLSMPPLRERRADISPLAKNFLAEFMRRGMTAATHFTPDALEELGLFAWPGNIRQLRNVVERLAVLSEGGGICRAEVRAALGGELSGHPSTPLVTLPETTLRKTVEVRRAAERKLLVDTLDQYQDNRRRAAAALGISRAALYKRLDRLGLK